MFKYFPHLLKIFKQYLNRNFGTNLSVRFFFFKTARNYRDGLYENVLRSSSNQLFLLQDFNYLVASAGNAEQRQKCQQRGFIDHWFLRDNCGVQLYQPRLFVTRGPCRGALPWCTNPGLLTTATIQCTPYSKKPAFLIALHFISQVKLLIFIMSHLAFKMA